MAGPSRDAALYRGDFLAVLIGGDAPADFQRRHDGMTRERAEAAEGARRLLRAATCLEEWGVALARWTLEAAMTGAANPGDASLLYESCRASLRPNVEELLHRVRKTSLVRRADVARAIGQCAAHHKLWETLARTPTAADEFNRFYWTPLHFALAFGSATIVEDVLSLHPHSHSARNAVGLTPLHVGVAHGSVKAVAVLAAGGGDVHAPDRQGRTPADLALEVSVSADRCRRMLAALGTTRSAAARRLCKAASTRRRRRALQLASVPRAAPPACVGNGGWGNGGWGLDGWGLGGLGEGGVHSVTSGVEDPGIADAMSEGGGGGDDDEEEDGNDGGEAQAKAEGASAHECMCGMMRLPTIDASSLLLEYLGIGMPLIVSEALAEAALHARWRRDAFVGTHGARVVRQEVFPYAHATAALYRVPKDNSSSLAQLAAALSASGQARSTVGEDGSALGGASDERQSVFTSLRAWRRLPYHGPSSPLSPHGDVELHPPTASLSAEAPEGLLADFSRPPFLEEPQWLLRTATIQFYLGPAASGAQPHWHGAAWNWLVHGRKRWYLWPPEEASYAQAHVTHALGAHALGAHTRANRSTRARGRAPSPWVCEQRSGEVFIVPELWGHATLNLRPSIGWASEVFFDRAFDDGLGEKHGDEWWRTHERPPPSLGRARRRHEPVPIALDRVEL